LRDKLTASGLNEAGDLGGDDLVDAKRELAEGGDEAAEGTEVNEGDDTTSEVDTVDETSVAEPAEEESALQAEDVVELEELVAGTEGEEVREGVEGKTLVDDERREDVVAEAVEGGEVGDVQVVEGEVVGAKDIEARAELDTSGELVESTEGETALLLSLLGGGGGRSEGGKSADEDAGELHFDGERVGEGVLD